MHVVNFLKFREVHVMHYLRPSGTVIADSNLDVKFGGKRIVDHKVGRVKSRCDVRTSITMSLLRARVLQDRVFRTCFHDRW